MDLSALWSYEKTRVSTGLTGSAVQLHASQRTRKISHAGNSAAAMNEAPSASVAASTSVNNNSHVGGRRPSNADMPAVPHRKKTISIFATRDMLFRKLVEESGSPSAQFTREGAGVTSHVPVASIFDCNEFSQEYADRGAPASSGSAASTQTSSSVPTSTNGASRVGTAGSPTVRHQRASARAGAASSALGPSASSPSLPASSLMATIPQLIPPRKNARKRIATDLNAAGHAFRPYVGDMFGTRGDYVDGMLYMSRMKRSYQATFGAGGRFSWNDLASPHARGNIKEALTDALLAASGGRMGGRHSGSGVSGGGAQFTDAARNDDGNGSTEQEGTTQQALEEEESADLGSELEEDLSGMDPAQRQQRRRRQRCALTLSNWSANPDNARLMVQENVVEALIQLSHCNGEDDDRITRLHCVTTLMNLSHLVELRAPMIAQGAVQTLAALVDASDDHTLRTACAIALCNLCGVEGVEEVLVAHGAVGALALLINEHPRVARICRGALFNLTCVSASYPKIENVLKVFVSFAASPPPAIQPPAVNGQRIGASKPVDETQDATLVTARALCNLSLIKRLRLRLLEEGVVGTIGSLLQPGAPLVQELLARVMLHLASLRACRSDLLAKGALGALVALTGGAAGSPPTKLLIAGALWHLSKEAELALRMVSEGLLLLVNELARGEPSSQTSGGGSSDALLAVCAHTLYNVSCREDARVKLVERDAVALLSSISRRVTTSDARKMCTLALCNLLSVQQAAAEILKTGAVAELIALSSAPDMAVMTPQSLVTRRLFARALHGLCDRSTTRVAVMDAGVVPALLILSGALADSNVEVDQSSLQSHQQQQLRIEVRARCTAALASLAADPRTAPTVCAPDVVACVAHILARERGNVAIERFCCACLSLLCRDEACAQIVVASDDESTAQTAICALSTVLATCVESKDLETKASGCQVLASISCHASCGAALLRTGTVSVLASLASVKERDPMISRCCAVTLANLSAEPAVRPVLVTAGAVALLSRLSNSYSEDSQRDCAAVLCNLSCIPGGEENLTREGAVRALLMIAMVRAVSSDTKDTCLRALLNLLNAETIKSMVAQEGIIKVLPAFATIAPPALVSLLFSKLLRHPVGRNALCSERRALQSLFELMCANEQSDTAGDGSGKTPSAEVDDGLANNLTILHESLISELVFYENSRVLSVQVGLVDALNKVAMDQLAMLEHEEDIDAIAITNCRMLTLASAMFTLSKHNETRPTLAAVPASLSTLVRFLAPHTPKDDCRDAKCADLSTSTLCVMSWHDQTREQVATAMTTSALVQLLHAVSSPSSRFPAYYPPSTVKTCVLTLCCLASHTELLEKMLAEGIIASLHGILVTGVLQMHSRAQDDERTSSVQAACASDADFVALVCILLRHLSQVAGFTAPRSTVQTLESKQQVVELFCALTQLADANGDVESCLDCADAFCSIVFGPLASTSASPTRFATSSTTSAPVLVVAPVVESVTRLMRAEQRPETRWRCCACLWALSSVPEHRSVLVKLGVTKLLVSEISRAAEGSNLNTLQCCAGALCNLTLTHFAQNSTSVDNTAPAMVAEGAVPALIALGKLDSDSVREFCTIALSNLSGPSPTVEAGAIAALITLSLGGSTSANQTGGGGPSPPTSGKQQPVSQPTASASLPLSTALPCRPPFVCGERHKIFASLLPDFEPEAPVDALHALHERKFESELAPSAPPPPRLPAFSAAEFAVAAGGDVGGERPFGSARVRRMSGGQTDLQPGTSQLDNNSVEDANGLPVMPQIKVFPKVDPSESLLAISISESTDTNGDEETSPANGSKRRGLFGGNQDEDNLQQPARIVAEQNATPTIDEDATTSARDESPSATSPSPAASESQQPALSSSSSLARVVGKKTQTVAATKKLRDNAQNARARKLLAVSGSLPSLPISQRNADPVSGISTDTLKRASLQSGLVGGADRVLASSVAPSKPAWQSCGADEAQNQLQAEDDLPNASGSGAKGAMDDGLERERQARAAIAAAAIAARLYNATPSDSVNPPTVEEIQRRAKTLGLWS